LWLDHIPLIGHALIIKIHLVDANAGASQFRVGCSNHTAKPLPLYFSMDAPTNRSRFWASFDAGCSESLHSPGSSILMGDWCGSTPTLSNETAETARSLDLLIRVASAPHLVKS
jgi:hypothetical protein